VRFVLRLGSRLVGTGGRLGTEVGAQRRLRVFRRVLAFVIQRLRLGGGTPTFGGAVGLGGRFVSSGGCLGANVDSGRCRLGVGSGGGDVVGLGLSLLQ
jgi:hypothetical protein